MLKSNYQIWITTYENKKPILSHVFYGNTEKEAIGYASSHLITDYFFSSSFVGSMNWHGSILKLSNDYKFIGYSSEDDIISMLEDRAEEINDKQNENGILMVIKKSSFK